MLSPQFLSKRTRLAALLGLALLAGVGAAAQPIADRSPNSSAALISDVSAVQPGSSFDVALRLELDPGWHAYWINPGDSGLPVKIDWLLPDGVTAGPLRFPPPERYDLEGITSYAHSGENLFLSRIAVPAGYSESSITLTGKATWLVCEAVCLPAEEDVQLTLPIGTPAPTEFAYAMEAARRAVPVPAEGWTVSASFDADDYLVTLNPPGQSVALEGAQFFPYVSGIIEHSAAQAFQKEGGAWAVRLAGSAFADAPSGRLRGILVAPEGAELADGVRSIEIDAEVAGVELAASDGSAAETASMGIWAALLFALGGGMLLNLMPCVFPILSIKILGFVEGRTDSRAKLRTHGLAFAGGVLVSFWAIAGLLIALRAGGESLGWGFQLQSPWIVGGLALLMVGLGLNLLGVFEVGLRLSSASAKLDRSAGPTGAFLSGVLATVVATPCTAPFMGAALGYALAQPAAMSMLVFTALGVGMAIPYVLLSFFPAWIERLPRPGAWMETLKQLLAFPLFATAVWLMWVFGLQTGVDGAAMLLLSALLLGFAAWFLGRWPSGASQPRARRIALAFAVIAALGAMSLFVNAARGSEEAVVSADETWRPFDTAEVEAMVADGAPVFVDFTAAWCLTCQVNKKTTLHTADVETAFEQAGVARFRADWTNRDADITAFLDRFGRSGVPMYVLYPGGGAEPQLLPEVLTPQIVLDALGATTGAVANR